LATNPRTLVISVSLSRVVMAIVNSVDISPR
jgi:hypothetical protein